MRHHRGAHKDEVIEMKATESKVYSFQLTRSQLEDEFWDDEATMKMMDVTLLLELAALQVIVGPWTQAIDGASKLLLAARGVQVVLPSRSSVPEPLARFWARLVSGELAYARSGDAWRFYKREACGWTIFDPLAYAVPGLEWRGVQHAAWLASKLQAGTRVVEEAFAIDGTAYEPCSAGSWETLKPSTPAGVPLIDVRTPDDASARLQLLSTAWGEEQTAFMAQVAFYLASPIEPRHFFILADRGGTGKSSFEKAFTSAFPSIATTGLDADNLASAGFTGGAALVPLIGKRVAFADEAGELGDRTMKAIAGLTTGISKQVRYGGGRIGFESFSLKLLFASNQAASFSPIEAVGRRKVEIPELQLKPASWWQEPAGEAWPGATRWQVCFSRETIFALVSRGWKLWQERHGEWPESSGKTMLRLSTELEEALCQPGVSTGPIIYKKPNGSGLIAVKASDWPFEIPDVKITAAKKKKIRGEALAKLGLSQKPGRIRGEMARWLCVSEPERWEQVRKQLLGDEKEPQAVEQPARQPQVEDPDVW